jgi:hypothetical protein
MRAWDDFVVSSHLAFAPAVAVAVLRAVYDAAVLITVMVFLSVWYHREAEKNTLVARIELCSTCALFAYGVAQCFHAPGVLVLAGEALCACVTVSTYAACFFICGNKALYNRWHPLGLHLVPAAWALAVAALHRSLLF